jgi:flagellar hook-associated protein 1 FlgK
MSLLSLLSIGQLGMKAGQLGTQVGAQNLSNVGTEGYSRKSANIRPEVGSSEINLTKRVVEPFVERRLLSARSASGEATAEKLALDPLDIVFSEGDGSLANALDAFQAGMQELTSRPGDLAVREQVLGRAANVSAAFKNAAAGLDQARADANARVTEGIGEVNERLRQIGALGAQINRVEVSGEEASDLRDRRDTLVREVSERIPVTVLETDNGGYALMLAGSQTLVSNEGKVSELSASDGSGDVRVQKMAAGIAVDVTDLVSSGSIGGQLKARDGALKDLETKLDRLAYDFASSYNAAHSAGVGLDGVSGRDIFEPLAGYEGAAAALEVSSDIAGNAAAIAAAEDGGALPSDNRVALRMAALASAPIALGGMTVTEALASLTGSAGMAVQSAGHAESVASGALEQVSALRDSMSGVSSDEEMVSMMRYQRAYEASLQVIQIADQMMGELMNMRR